MKEAYWAGHAEKIKEAVGALPVMVVGGLKYPQTIEAVEEEGKADLVSLARALIREPTFPRSRRKAVEEHTDQRLLPVIETADGTWIRDDSRALIERINAGEFD